MAKVITVLLYLICRFDPYEKGSKHCEGKKCEGSRFDFLGSLWFVCGGLTLQGYTNRPRSAAGLVLSAIWWSFSIIILATYIMGLVSTQARAMFAVPGLKIRNLGDLLAQNETSFGCIQSGSTFTFFKQSNVASYQKAYQRMKAFSDSSLVKSTKDGLDKVENGGYAYIGESTIIDYLVRRRCDTVKVGGVLDRKSYALACAEGSPYTAELSKGLLILREKGILRMLQAKWWDSDAECKDGYEVTSSMFLPSESAKFSPKTVIDLTIFGGIFFYLIIGVVLAVVTLLIEILVYRRRKNSEPKEKALEADKEEKDGSQKMQEIA